MRISDWSSDVCSSDLGSWHRPTQLRGRLRHHCRSHPVDIPRGPARRDAELPFNAGPDARRSHVQGVRRFPAQMARSEEHTSELQSLMRISYAVLCLKKKNPYDIMLTHIRISYQDYIEKLMYRRDQNSLN